MAGYEPGRYRLKITNQGFGESKTKGTPYFFLEGEPTAKLEGDDAWQVEFTHARSISLWITENTAETVAEKLKALGWAGGKWSSLDPNKPNFHSFIGEEIEAVCVHEPGLKGDGRLYEKWDLPWGEREALQSNPTVASKLDAMFGKAAAPAKAAGRKPAAKTAATATASVASANGDDDVPF